MPLNSSQIVLRPSALVSDATSAQNGGRMRPNAIVASGVKNALWPDVGEAERQAGSTKYRKAFFSLSNPDSTALQNPRVFMDKKTPGGDGAVFHIGTHTDTLDQMLTAAPRAYGVASLHADVDDGDTELIIDLESAAIAALEPFKDGDLIRISSRPVGGSTGVEEFATIDSVEYDGTEATITLADGLALDHSAADTIVSSVYEPADVVASVSAVTVDSDAGTFGSDKIIVNNKGAIAQNWTLTFTSGTDFVLSGDSLGANVATGNTSINLAPLNPNGAPYFTLSFSGFGGTFAVGDTLTFSTSPAAVPIWQRRIVPAGTASVSNDAISLAITGEAA